MLDGPQIFHRGCVAFKWSCPLFHPVATRCIPVSSALRWNICGGFIFHRFRKSRCTITSCKNLKIMNILILWKGKCQGKFPRVEKACWLGPKGTVSLWEWCCCIIMWLVSVSKPPKIFHIQTDRNLTINELYATKLRAISAYARSISQRMSSASLHHFPYKVH